MKDKEVIDIRARLMISKVVDLLSKNNPDGYREKRLKEDDSKFLLGTHLRLKDVEAEEKIGNERHTVKILSIICGISAIVSVTLAVLIITGRFQ
jgi:hypothetical protein